MIFRVQEQKGISCEESLLSTTAFTRLLNHTAYFSGVNVGMQ